MQFHVSMEIFFKIFFIWKFTILTFFFIRRKLPFFHFTYDLNIYYMDNFDYNHTFLQA